MGDIEHSPKLWAIQFSNGWRYTNDQASVDDARARGLPVVEYVPASQLGGAVGILEQAVAELDGWRDRGNDVMRDELVDDFVTTAKAFLASRGGQQI